METTQRDTNDPTQYKFANQYGYTDMHPYEIIRHVNDKTLDVREMRSTPLPWERHWVSGGFAGHLTNQQDQQWEITSNFAAPIVRIRLGKRGWWNPHYGAFALAHTPVRFRDYNF